MKSKTALKTLMALGIALIALGLIVSLSTTIFSYTITFSEYGGVIIESSNEVSVTNPQIARAGSAVPAAGTSQASPVTMASPPLPLASTGVPKNNWYYRVDISAIAGTTPPSTTFRVELYRWDPNTYEYNLLGTLYIRSTSNPQSSEGVRLYFNLGSASPSQSEAFMVLISRV